MTDDIVTRLREHYCQNIYCCEVSDEAADEIERLRKEKNKTLTAPLCTCGRSLTPDLINVSSFDQTRYIIEWYCTHHNPTKEQNNG